jgi:cephalosporin hydroxylase
MRIPGARTVQGAVAPVFAPLATRAMRRAVTKVQTPDEALDVAYDFHVWGITIRPMQVRSELRSLVRMVEDRPPRVVLEIGTANGGTLFVLARTASPDATIISVDLPGGDFGGGYPRWKRGLYRTFATERQQLFLIQGDSHREETIAHVRDLLNGRSVDLLLIDGDHTYEGVRRDFDAYNPFVANGGILAFHDIVPENPQRKSEYDLCSGQVPRFWSELRARYEHAELVDDWKQGAMGIGILSWPPREAPRSMEPSPPAAGGGR